MTVAISGKTVWIDCGLFRGNDRKVFVVTGFCYQPELNVVSMQHIFYYSTAFLKDL